MSSCPEPIVGPHFDHALLEATTSAAVTVPSCLDSRLEESTHKLLEPGRCLTELARLASERDRGLFVDLAVLTSPVRAPFLRALCACAQPGRSTASESYECGAGEFAATRQAAGFAVPLLANVLAAGDSVAAVDLAVASATRSASEEILDELVLLAASNAERHGWNTDSVVMLLHGVLSTTACRLRCASADELVLYEGGACREAPARRLAAYVREHLQRRRRQGGDDEEWRRWPGAVAAFRWLVERLRFPAMSNYVETLVPASLLLVDDYASENRMTGVLCLDRIVQHCGKTELTWHNRADVIYDALVRLTYTRESDLIAVLYPCLLRVLDVVERCPPFDCPGSVTHHHVVFERLLDEMSTEDKIALRQIYSAQLALYIDKMGVYSVRHLKKLISIVTWYLEVGDGVQETARINILIALQRLLHFAWPRLSTGSQVMPLLKVLTKLLVDISIDFCSEQPPADGVKSLSEQAVCCLSLLASCSEDAGAAIHVLRHATETEQGLSLAAKCFAAAAAQSQIDTASRRSVATDATITAAGDSVKIDPGCYP